MRTEFDFIAAKVVELNRFRVSSFKEHVIMTMSDC